MSASLAVPQFAATATLQFPEWQREYVAALFELNPAKLPQRVMVAELMLRKRLLAIAQKQDTNGERQNIETALSNLHWLMMVLG